MGRGSKWAWAGNSVSCWGWGLEVSMWLGQGWGRGGDETREGGLGVGGCRQVTAWAGAMGEGLGDSQSRAWPGGASQP